MAGARGVWGGGWGGRDTGGVGGRGVGGVGGRGVDRAHWRKKATWSGFPPASDGYVEDFLAHGMHDCSA